MEHREIFVMHEPQKGFIESYWQVFLILFGITFALVLGNLK